MSNVHICTTLHQGPDLRFKDLSSQLSRSVSRALNLQLPKYSYIVISRDLVPHYAMSHLPTKDILEVYFYFFLLSCFIGNDTKRKC